MKNKKSKKGFTLIELLAVIVILAIISLIAVPIVLNIIEDSKDSTNIRSAENIVKSVNLSLSKLDLTDAMGENKLLDGWYCISEGCTLNPLSKYVGDIEIENNNSKNNSLVLIKNNQVIDYSIVIDNYKITKDGTTEINSETLYSEIYGKKALFVGDSISAMNGGYAKLVAENYLNRYPDGTKINDISSCGYENNDDNYKSCNELANTGIDIANLSCLNFSHSGYGFTNQITSAPFPIYGELFLNYNDSSGLNLPYDETLDYDKLNYKTEETYIGYDPDYVIIEGAYNDKSFELGEYCETTDPNADCLRPETIIGGLQKTILMAKDMYPDAKIGYILVYKITNEGYQKNMIQSIIDTCIKMDVPMLNLHDGYFNINVDKEVTYNSDVYNAITKQITLNGTINFGDVFIEDYNKFLDTDEETVPVKYLMCDLSSSTSKDRVHPSPFGLTLFYPTVAQWMNTL